MSGAMLEAFEDNGDSLQLRKMRLKSFAAMLVLVKKLEDEEIKQHSAMPQHLQMVLRGKRTLLFEQLLQQISYPDVSVASEMRRGFPLYGWLPVSNVFPSSVRAPVIHTSSLETMAPIFSRRTLATVKSSGDADQDTALWEATMQEVEAGYLEGPYMMFRFCLKVALSPLGSAWLRRTSCDQLTTCRLLASMLLWACQRSCKWKVSMKPLQLFVPG